MKTYVKSLLERAARNRIWIEHTAGDKQLEEFFRSVRPEAITPELKRFGGDGDGAYLIPDDLERISALVSPGVSTEVDFDLEFAEMGIPVFMADASVDGPPVDHENFNFYKKFIGVQRNDVFMTLDDLCNKIPEKLDGDRLLQMDIESAEYSVLLDIKEETLKKFRIMAIEFHFLPQLYSKFSFNIIKSVFDKLLQYHRVVHIHPNNCNGSVRKGKFEIPQLLEITFYRRDRGGVKENSKLQFPNPEDVDICSGNSPLVLPECWR